MSQSKKHTFASLEKEIGIKFNQRNLLKNAFIHRSYLNEVRKGTLESNERLEFLGDAVLEFIVSRWLFLKFPEYPEGVLTNIRSNLVNTKSLAKIAREMKLGQYLFLSKGEKESEGHKNPSLLANTVEALLGAIYLDRGIKAAKKFVIGRLNKDLKQLIKIGKFKDYKSVLQEKLQAREKRAPIYKILKESGPDHDKIFTVGVFDQKKLIATAQGKSKQMAEEQAAKKALEKQRF
jgi:ribonuclease-3